MAIVKTDRVRTVAAWSAALVMAMSAGACASGGMGMAAMGSPDAAAFATTTAVDMAEVEEAQLALQKAQNAQVRQYAQRMVTDHAPAMQKNLQTMDAMGMDGMNHGSSGSQMNTSASGGVNEGDASANATAANPMAQAMLMRNPYSRPLVEDHMRAMQMLQSTQAGMAFDRAYMMRQVAAHRSALAAIDNLMPSVQATGQTETRGMMMQHRAAVEQHLRMAEQMVASMGG